jgi:hypothetical protein
MRTEIEIRRALDRLGPDGENEEPQLTDDGVMLPLNRIAKDVLRWALGDPSDFGSALDDAVKRFDAANRAGRN